MQGDPQLVIGRHQLDGKVVSLKRPLALVERVADDSSTPSGELHFEVIGYAKKKYVFKARPRPISDDTTTKLTN